MLHLLGKRCSCCYISHSAIAVATPEVNVVDAATYQVNVVAVATYQVNIVVAATYQVNVVAVAIPGENFAGCAAS